MRQADRDYYRQRAETEFMIASRSGDDCARAIHLQLAELYENLLSDSPSPVPHPGTVGGEPVGDTRIV